MVAAATVEQTTIAETKKIPMNIFREGHRIRTNIPLSFFLLFLLFILKVDRTFLSKFPTALLPGGPWHGPNN